MRERFLLILGAMVVMAASDARAECKPDAVLSLVRAPYAANSLTWRLEQEAECWDTCAWEWGAEWASSKDGPWTAVAFWELPIVSDGGSLRVWPRSRGLYRASVTRWCNPGVLSLQAVARWERH